MSPTQNITSSEITSGQQTTTPSILVKSEAFAGGWSSSELAFRSRGVTTSTLLAEPSSPEAQNFVVLFEQADPVNPDDLSAIVYLHEGFGQISVHTTTGALTKMSVQSGHPIMTALLSAGGRLILKPTHIESAVFRRISQLMELATEDEIEMSSSSFCDLWAFISARPVASVPNVFALDNGNFRAVWKNAEGERVALEFQGSQTVGFVIFAQARSLGKMMRVAGVQTLRQVPAHIAAAYAGHLLTK
jgi:hypothetical protein